MIRASILLTLVPLAWSRVAIPDRGDGFQRLESSVNGGGQEAVIGRYLEHIKRGKIEVEPLCGQAGLREKQSVAIIGAGITGLVTGKLLASSGFDVVIVEASNRIGGRIYTHRDPEGRWFAELGPMRIPELHHRLTMELVKMYGLKMAPFMHKYNELYINHKLWNITEVMECFDDFTRSWLNVEDLRPPAVFQEAMREVETDYQTLAIEDMAEKYDQYSLQDWLRVKTNFTPHEMMVYSMLTHLESSYHQSLIETVADDVLYAKDQKWVEVAGGFDQIPGAVQNDSKAETLLGMKTVKIERKEANSSNESVAVHLRCNGDGLPSCSRVIEVDHAIVTPSGYVTAGIDFVPPMDSEKAHSLRSIGYSSAVKVFLVFRSQWWNKAGGLLTDFRVRRTYFPVVTSNESGIGVLLASYVMGADSKRYTGMKDESIVREILQDLGNIYGKSYDEMREKLIDHKIQRWLLDENFLGGWAAFEPLQLRNYYSHLRKPEGRVKFAGGHTDYPHGWINTALKSGIRAAEEVIRDACRGQCRG